MPSKTSIPLHPVSQSEFGRVAYEVVGHAFAIHKRLGRIFDESVYRKTLAHVLAAVDVLLHFVADASILGETVFPLGWTTRRL